MHIALAAYALGVPGLPRFATGSHFNQADFAAAIGIELREAFGLTRGAIGLIDPAIAVGIHSGKALLHVALHFGWRDRAILIGIGTAHPVTRTPTSRLGKRYAARQKRGKRYACNKRLFHVRFLSG